MVTVDCQSGVWSQQFDGFEFVELNVTSMNSGVGAVNLGVHKLCSIAGIGGERPHGYVYRTSTTADASGRYPFQASWNGYSSTMDLRVTQCHQPKLQPCPRQAPEAASRHGRRAMTSRRNAGPLRFDSTLQDEACAVTGRSRATLPTQRVFNGLLG